MHTFKIAVEYEFDKYKRAIYTRNHILNREIQIIVQKYEIVPRVYFVKWHSLKTVTPTISAKQLV